MLPSFFQVEYQGSADQAAWTGYKVKDCEELSEFMRVKVAARARDQDGHRAFQDQLSGLALTEFGAQNLEQVLNSEVPEEKAWAIGESFAEVVLTESHYVEWPWHTDRDKRNPDASLAGADLIGFLPHESDGYRLALGEVKTSSDKQCPPNVMSGRSGMSHQIDRLCSDTRLLLQILMWLSPRCKGTDFESKYENAVTNFFNSGRKAAIYFGVLIRDTAANELDLRARGTALGASVSSPGSCALFGVYLPHPIAELPSRLTAKEKS